MALGIMLVVSIALTATIYFTSATARHANTSNAGQKAYALAEAGVNNAIGQLASHYPNPTTPGPTTPGDLWVGSPSPVPYGSGTTQWSGLFDSEMKVWTLTGIGKVKNPTGGSDITRTVTAKVRVTLGPPPFTRYGLFVDDAIGPCTEMNGDNTITVPIYAAGCLSLGGGVTIVEPSSNPSDPTTVSANVGGQLSVSGSSHVGTDSREINWVGTKDGCNPHPAGVPCGDVAGVIRAESYGTYLPVHLPAVDADTEYGKANWSTAACSTGANPFDSNGVRNNSLGTTDLMGKAYDCTAKDGSNNVVGQLGWNPSFDDPLATPTGDIPPRTLRLSGTIFVDGDLALAPSDGFQYSGDGTIYVNGVVDLKGTICGPGSSWDAKKNTCGKTWSPLQGLGALLIVATNKNNAYFAVNFGSQAVVEAGLWAIGNVDGSGGPYLGGSVFVDEGFADITGGGGMQAFINLPAGAPSGQQYILGTALEFAGG
jgi:hypothetical protein